MSNVNNVIEISNGNIKIVKYNKPTKKNAIDYDMYLEITRILNDTAKDDNITVTVLTGVGDYYSSGNDTRAVLKNNSTNFIYVLKEYIRAFIEFPKLLIAIVNGPAFGIAATTLALCDLVFASEDSYFYTPFTKLGIVAEGCSTLTFPRLIGNRKAAEMLLFDYKMSAKEALECGFVNYLYKPIDLQSKVWDKIIEVSKLPQQSITGSKKLLRYPIQDLLLTNERELEELQKIWQSGDRVNIPFNKSKI